MLLHLKQDFPLWEQWLINVTLIFLNYTPLIFMEVECVCVCVCLGANRLYPCFASLKSLFCRCSSRLEYRGAMFAFGLILHEVMPHDRLTNTSRTVVCHGYPTRLINGDMCEKLMSLLWKTNWVKKRRGPWKPLQKKWEVVKDLLTFFF